jgi:hypothetical protein
MDNQNDRENSQGKQNAENVETHITSININIHDSRGRDLQSTSKANISTTIAKSYNLMDIDIDKVKISTPNGTLNIQMDVENIATRMKSNKRRRNKTNERTRKKSRKTWT